MNVNVGISGIGSSARMRALMLVRDAIAKREQQREGPRGTAAPSESVQLSTDAPSERGR
jgi:hypothetical protein